MTTLRIRRSADWEGPWIDAGETMAEAERAMLELCADQTGPEMVDVRNDWNGSAARFEVWAAGRATRFAFSLCLELLDALSG